MFGGSLWSSMLIDLGCHWHVPLLCDHGIGGFEQGGRCRNSVASREVVKGGGWIAKVGPTEDVVSDPREVPYSKKRRSVESLWMI